MCPIDLRLLPEGATIKGVTIRIQNDGGWILKYVKLDSDNVFTDTTVLDFRSQNKNKIPNRSSCNPSGMFRFNFWPWQNLSFDNFDTRYARVASRGMSRKPDSRFNAYKSWHECSDSVRSANPGSGFRDSKFARVGTGFLPYFLGFFFSLGYFDTSCHTRPRVNIILSVRFY